MLFNPLTFYWCTCTKPGDWAVLYVCVRILDFASVSKIFKFYFVTMVFSVFNFIPNFNWKYSVLFYFNIHINIGNHVYSYVMWHTYQWPCVFLSHVIYFNIHINISDLVYSYIMWLKHQYRWSCVVLSHVIIHVYTFYFKKC